jgi:hypothetical protein
VGAQRALTGQHGDTAKSTLQRDQNDLRAITTVLQFFMAHAEDREDRWLASTASGEGVHRAILESP